MGFLKYLVPALAVAGLAAAQDGPCKGTKTVQNQGDATALATCSTISGDLVVASQAANVLALDGIKHITGSLSCNGARNLSSLTADQLETIGDDFKLSGLTLLNTLQFDSLTEVGTIDFEALSQLQQLDFKKGVVKATKVRITNTYLNSLTGIELKTVGDMDVSNNPRLTQVNVDDIVNITGLVTFSANNPDLKITFPKLQTAKNMTFRNASEVELPSLKTTDGLLGFYSNYFSTFVGPNLTSTGSLVFTDNAKLTNISLPVLETVKGVFQIANNTALKSVDGFPKLKSITGALDFSGNFSKVDLPSLKEVRGGFNMQSSGTLDCDGFSKLRGNVIEGTYTCRSGVSDPQSVGGTPTSADSKPTKKGGAGAVNPPAIMSLMALLGGILHFTL